MIIKVLALCFDDYDFYPHTESTIFYSLTFSLMKKDAKNQGCLDSCKG